MSYNISQINSGYVSLNSAGLGESAGAAAKMKTTATLAYTIDGVFKSLSANDDIAFSAGHTALAANQACLFAVWVDGSANDETACSTTQGPVVSAGEPCPVPPTPNNKALIGLVKVTTGATTFTPGTTDLGAANVTDAYFDCMVMPGEAL
jgi:hypothetical protein